MGLIDMVFQLRNEYNISSWRKRLQVAVVVILARGAAGTKGLEFGRTWCILGMIIVDGKCNSLMRGDAEELSMAR